MADLRGLRQRLAGRGGLRHRQRLVVPRGGQTGLGLRAHEVQGGGRGNGKGGGRGGGRRGGGRRGGVAPAVAVAPAAVVIVGGHVGRDVAAVGRDFNRGGIAIHRHKSFKSRICVFVSHVVVTISTTYVYVYVRVRVEQTD